MNGLKSLLALLALSEMFGENRKPDGEPMSLADLLTSLPDTDGPKYDDSEKNIGDKVKLLDPFSINYFADCKSGEQLSKSLQSGHEKYKELFEKEAIVAEVGIERTYNCGHCTLEHEHDMVVFYPHNKTKYFVHHKMFKVVE